MKNFFMLYTALPGLLTPISYTVMPIVMVNPVEETFKWMAALDGMHFRAECIVCPCVCTHAYT